MSTRGIIASSTADGTWKGTWSLEASETQHLGRALIRRVAKAKGDMQLVVTEVIDGCPEGWASFDKLERCEDPVGFTTGTFDGVIATCDGEKSSLVFDTHYLYLFHLPKRRLYVFAITQGPMRPFGMVTFDELGKAKPTKLPAIEDEAR